MALDEVTRDELQAVIGQLKEALYNHQQWYGALIRTCCIGNRYRRNEPIHVSASFGLALLDPGIPVEKSIDRADKALFVAKTAGKNCVRIWDSSMQ